MKDSWIAAIARGHNAGVCLLKNGEIVFAIEEERLSRKKYDGGPYASMLKILEYTDTLDYLVVAHTQSLADTAGRVDFSGDDIYTGLARKLGLIDRHSHETPHPQVIDFSHMHHRLHAACAFYRSGFETATAVIADGAGTFIPLNMGSETITGWETETIFDCSYPANFPTMYKHIGTRGPHPGAILETPENGRTYKTVVTDRAGIVKAYEAVTQYCGFSAIEAGKTMGLFPYGKENDKFPKLFEQDTKYPLVNRNIIVPTYPNAGAVNSFLYDELESYECDDLTTLQNRRDMAYAVQTETQAELAKLIKHAVEITGNKNVVVSGGYGLNCVANYYYLEALKDEGINLYVEPVSSDAGTAIGAAFMMYKTVTGDSTVYERSDDLYLGPLYNDLESQIEQVSKKYDANVEDASHDTVIDLITSKNIVALFQGRSENGPRALGNRSLIFDPTFEDGKDFVNMIKRREYFRPFAGSILEEDVHEWFDLRGMESSPTMMYAVNCQPGIEEKIPSIIHVDGTCRIQTVNRDQNPHYYDIIKTFKERTGTPIVFNTSFNLGGEPLVETLDDACRTLAESDIEYLYLPEIGKMINIKN
jgi:carbamoyltransferase